MSQDFCDTPNSSKMLFTIKRSAVKKAPVSLNAHRGLLFYCGLVAGLGQRSGIFKAVHRGYPNGVRRLPLVEVLAADIGAVDDLVVVAHVAVHLHLQRRLHGRRKPARDSAELIAEISDIFTLSKAERAGGELDRVVVARQQVGRQNAVVVQVGLEHDPVIRPLQDMKNPHRRKEEQ